MPFDWNPMPFKGCFCNGALKHATLRQMVQFHLSRFNHSSLIPLQRVLIYSDVAPKGVKNPISLMSKGWISSVNMSTLFLVLLYMLVISELSSRVFGKTITFRRNPAMQLRSKNCAQIFNLVYKWHTNIQLSPKMLQKYSISKLHTNILLSMC